MTDLRVTAPLVAVVDENNTVRHLTKGDVVPGSVKKESLDNLRRLGYVEDADGGPKGDEGKTQRRPSSK